MPSKPSIKVVITDSCYYLETKKVKKRVHIQLDWLVSDFSKTNRFIEGQKGKIGRLTYRGNDITYLYKHLLVLERNMRPNCLSVKQLLFHIDTMESLKKNYVIKERIIISESEQAIRKLLAIIYGEECSQPLRYAFKRQRANYIYYAYFNRILRSLKRRKLKPRRLLITCTHQNNAGNYGNHFYSNLLSLLDKKNIKYALLKIPDTEQTASNISFLASFVRSYLQDRHTWTTDYYDREKLNAIKQASKELTISGEQPISYKGVDLTPFLRVKMEEFRELYMPIIADYMDTINKATKNTERLIIPTELNFFGMTASLKEKRKYKVIALSSELIHEAYYYQSRQGLHVDRKIAWSHYYELFLVKKLGFPKEVIKIAGDPRIHLGEYNESVIKAKPRVVFIAGSDFETMNQYMEALLKEDYEVYCKVRPTFRKNPFPSEVKLLKSMDAIHDERYDVFVTDSSTYGIEALGSGKITYFIDLNNKYLNIFPPRERLDKLLVRSPEELLGKLRSLTLNAGKEERIEAKRYLKTIIGYEPSRKQAYQQAFINALS